MRASLSWFPFSLFLALVLLQHSNPTSASVVNSKRPVLLENTQSRFLFWERCKDIVVNNSTEETEECCRGNYRCSSDKCKTSTLCRISGFRPNFLSCHYDGCKVLKEKLAKNRAEEEEDEQPEPSAELEEILDEGDGADEEGGDGGIKPGSGSSASPSPTPAPAASRNPTQSSTPTPTPSRTPSPSPVPSPTRSVTPSPRPAAPSPSPPGTRQTNPDLLNCDGLRYRRDIRDLSSAERRQWQEAMLETMTDIGPDGVSEWDRLVQMHMDSSWEAHGGSYFLPWHRLFLLRLENLLRRRRPSIALPYWDWSIDASDAAMSEVWRGVMAGGARRGSNPIQNGLFRNLRGNRPGAHIVRRDFTSGVSGQIPLLWNRNSMLELVRRQDFGDFSDGVESAHNLPHIYIGGDMRDTWYAPNDPVFYLHHAFIDRMYSLRQAQFGRNNFGGTHDFSWGTEPANPDRVMSAFRVPVRTAFAVDCVRYIPSSLQGRHIAGREQTEKPASICEFFANSNRTSPFSARRCERGEGVLNKSR